MNNNLYEFVPYEQTNYLYQLGDNHYCLPHLHKEYEFGMVLGGELHINPRRENIVIYPGEFWILNPYQCHEFAARSPQETYVFLELQVPKSFFRAFFPSIDQIVFDSVRITRNMMSDEGYLRLKQLLCSSARYYFNREPAYEIRCAGDLNYIFAELIHQIPYTIKSQEQAKSQDHNLKRMARILEYIDIHASEKLLLRDIATRENLTLNYLSHNFKECFGLSFQTYLQNVRCHNASVLLIESDASPTEISQVCGFSALKYMNQAFRELFQMTPQQFRTYGRTENTVLSSIQRDFGRKESMASQEKGIVYTRRVLPKTFSPKDSLLRMDQLGI